MDLALREPIPLEQATRLPVEVVGGKASRLAKLRVRGFAVPDGFVLSTAVHERAVRLAGEGSEPSAPELPEEIRREFIVACDRLGYPLIVRSSAVAEDLASASFAGQFESVLHVGSAVEAMTAVERCWRAASSGHLSDYQRAHGAADGPVALLVQRQLAPTSAGVGVRARPGDGDDRAIVEAVPGLADRLLEGELTPERWVVSSGQGGAGCGRRRRPRASCIGCATDSSDGLPPRGDLPRPAGRGMGVRRRRTPCAAESSDHDTSSPTGVASCSSRPVPAAWLRDSLHFPDRLSPFGAEVWRSAVHRGLAEATATFGLLIATGDLHMVDHRAYLEVIPFGPRRLPPPPSWLLPVLIRYPAHSLTRRARGRRRPYRRPRPDPRALDRYRSIPALWPSSSPARAIDLAAMDMQRLLDHLDDTVEFFERACTEHWVAMFAVAQTLARLRLPGT